MEIENKTFRDFLKQTTEEVKEQMIILSVLKPKPTKREIYFLPLEDVEFIKENQFSENIWDLINILLKVGEKNPMDMRILDVFPKLHSIREQIEEIAHIEKSLTPNSEDLKSKMVNYGKRMSKYGIYNTLERLSGGNILEWDRVRKMSYDEVFVKLSMEKEKADLKREMDAIKTVES